jgi:hypothetical protein
VDPIRSALDVADELDPGAIGRVARRAVELRATNEQAALSRLGVTDIQVAGQVVDDVAIAGRPERRCHVPL